MGGRLCYSPGTQLVRDRPRLEPQVSILCFQKTLTSLKITEHKELGHLQLRPKISFYKMKTNKLIKVLCWLVLLTDYIS